MSRSYWQRTHRPVLFAAVAIFDEQGGGPVSVPQIAEHTGLTERDVWRALNALEAYDPPLFDRVERNLNRPDGITRPTRTARELVSWRHPGAWPSATRRAEVIALVSLVLSAVALVVGIVAATK